LTVPDSEDVSLSRRSVGVRNWRKRDALFVLAALAIVAVLEAIA
jgi:hypothetical protein